MVLRWRIGALEMGGPGVRTPGYRDINTPSPRAVALAEPEAGMDFWKAGAAEASDVGSLFSEFSCKHSK